MRMRLFGVGVAMVVAFTAVGCAADAPPPAAPTTPASTARLTDFAATHPEWLTNNHVRGHVTYKVSPPVGGDHNPVWQNCAGDVYPAQIANEHAVHSMEHGAVWVTYRPDLPAAQVNALATRVQDRPYMLMSPYPTLDAPISLQAWGFQLKADDAADPAIDAFIRAHRAKGSPEPGATCSGGVTDTGTTPLDLS